MNFTAGEKIEKGDVVVLKDGFLFKVKAGVNNSKKAQNSINLLYVDKLINEVKEE